MENQHPQSLRRAAVFTLCIVAAAVIGWEIFWRSKGFGISYDDGGPLWSDKRARAYEPSENAVVFIGSSRIKYDLDLDTWEKTTGTQAVQLAIEGSCPRPVLEDLAADPAFKGRLVVDVTEGLFFSNAPPNMETPVKNVKFYHDRTPAQRASFWLNRALESRLVFLDKDNFSLNAQLDALEIQSRPGVFMMPIFPTDFGRVSFGRQMLMTDRFLADTLLQNRVKGIWQFFASLAKGAPPMPDDELNAIFQSVKAATDKIRARGGEVVFVRTPSSGPYWQGEMAAFPREKYWNRLLAETGCKGIHFADYPAIAGFTCPEWSHLSPADAVVFTRHFIGLLENEMHWKL